MRKKELRGEESYAFFSLSVAFSVISLTTPTAIVLPMSRIAKRPSCGISEYASIGNGRSGLIFTRAASPVLRKSGFSCVTWPERASIFCISSVIVAEVVAVCACITGVYPAAIAVGWKTTMIWPMNSFATVGGLSL